MIFGPRWGKVSENSEKGDRFDFQGIWDEECDYGEDEGWS